MTQPTKLNYITTPFKTKGSWAAGYHTGIDYRAEVGTKVHATKRGKVIRKGWDNSYGYYVVIQSWHYWRYIQHWYCHLSKPSTVGLYQKVVAGDVVGLSGNTGNSTGPHLHYEERVKPFGYYNHIKPVLPWWKPKNPIVYKNILKRIGITQSK